MDFLFLEIGPLTAQAGLRMAIKDKIEFLILLNPLSSAGNTRVYQHTQFILCFLPSCSPSCHVSLSCEYSPQGTLHIRVSKAVDKRVQHGTDDSVKDANALVLV